MSSSFSLRVQHQHTDSYILVEPSQPSLISIDDIAKRHQQGISHLPGLHVHVQAAAPTVFVPPLGENAPPLGDVMTKRPRGKEDRACNHTPVTLIPGIHRADEQAKWETSRIYVLSAQLRLDNETSKEPPNKAELARELNKDPVISQWGYTDKQIESKLR